MNAAAGGGSASAPAEPVTTPGELLRSERERRGLSVQQAAEDLHLDAWMIEAIEANRFLALGAPVYAKGHLRKYALLLGLAPASVIQLYEALSDTPVVPTPIPATITAPGLRERPSLKVPLRIVAAVVVLAIGWWVFETLTAPSTEVASLPAPPGVESPNGAGSALLDDAAVASTPVEQSMLTRPAAEPQPSVPAAPRTTPPVVRKAQSSAPTVEAGSAEKIRLRLEFSEASWVEIYDASGNRLMFDMGMPGAVRNLAGTPPLQVTFGLAAAVSAQVNDEAIVVPRQANKNSTRFAIGADGSVRQ